MTDQDRNEDELVSEIVELCGQIAEIGATLLIKRGIREAPSEAEPGGQGAKVYDLPWWAERAMRLKALEVGDIASLSPEDVARLIREFQAHQVEAKMQYEELKRNSSGFIRS
jgi:hypothetical protein